MSRSNLLLVGVLVVQVALIVVTHRGGESHTLHAAEPLLPDLDSDSIERLEIRRAGDADEVVVLEQQDGTWLVTSHRDYPADDTKVSSALAALSGMTSRRAIASGESRFSQLGVAENEPVRSLAIVGAEGETTTVYLGNPAGRGKTAVRIEGSDEVHAVAGVRASTFPTKVASWVKPEYLDIDREAIASAEVSAEWGTALIEPGEQGFAVSANGEPLAPGEGQELDQAFVERLLGALTSVRLREPVAPMTEATPVATSILRLQPAADGESGDDVVVDYYAADGDAFVIHDRQSQHWVEVAGSAIAVVVELERDDFFRDADQADESGSALPGPGGAGLPPGLGTPQ